MGNEPANTIFNACLNIKQTKVREEFQKPKDIIDQLTELIVRIDLAPEKYSNPEEIKKAIHDIKCSDNTTVND